MQGYDAVPCLQPIFYVFISGFQSHGSHTSRLLDFQHSSRFLTNAGYRFKSSFWFLCWKWGQLLDPAHEIWNTLTLLDLQMFSLLCFGIFMMVLSSYKRNICCMCFALQAFLKHAVQNYSLWPSPALAEAIEISLLIQVRAGAHWNHYSITEIITEMHRVNRKLHYLKYFYFPFHLLTVSEGRSLAPATCLSRSGMPEFCCSGPSVDLGVVFECPCVQQQHMSPCCGHEEDSRSTQNSRSVPWHILVQKKTFASWSTIPVHSEKYSTGCVWCSPLWKGLSPPGGTRLAVWEHLLRVKTQPRCYAFKLLINFHVNGVGSHASWMGKIILNSCRLWFSNCSCGLCLQVW